MKHLLLTTIAAVVLVRCDESASERALLEAAREGNIEAVKQHIATGTNVEPKRSTPKVPAVAKADARSLFTAADLVVVAKAPMGGSLRAVPFSSLGLSRWRRRSRVKYRLTGFAVVMDGELKAMTKEKCLHG